MFERNTIGTEACLERLSRRCSEQARRALRADTSKSGRSDRPLARQGGSSRSAGVAGYALTALLAAGAVACEANLGGPSGGSGGGSGATLGSGSANSGSGGTIAGSGGTGGAEVVVLPGGLELEGQPVYHRVVRLTHAQWENSVRDVLALPETTGLSSGFISDPPNGKFSNNERALYVTDTLWSDYQRSAEQVAEMVATDAAALDRLADPADSAAFISAVGERAFRRALTADEKADYEALWARGAELFQGADADADGARIFLEALLQAPQFLYRVELSEAGTRLSGLELATRVSLLLRETVPSPELRAAALAGELDTDEGLRSVVASMLDEDPTRTAAEHFHRELFGLDRYGSILKSTTTFPEYEESLNQIFLDADVLFFSRVYSEGFGLREILLSNVAFVEQKTAGFYGLSSTESELTEVTVGADRPGFLTRLGFLAYNGTLSHPDPIHRGVDINNRLLCAHLSPPAGEIPPLPDPIPGQTNRQRVEGHTGDGFCGNCHATLINPPGFALEGFDAIGRARSMDNGQPIDTTGTFEVQGQELTFQSISDLAQQLAEGATTHSCYAANLGEFAFARDMGVGEAALLTSAQAESQSMNASVKELLLTLIASPEFTTARAAEP